MFNLLRNSPRVSPAIKQAVAHMHAYPFPLSPGGEWGAISRLNSPLPSPLIRQPNFSVIRTPPVGEPSSSFAGYPFPTTSGNPKRIHFQLTPQTIVDLPTGNQNSERSIKVLESKAKRPAFSMRQRTNLRLDLPEARTVFIEEITQSINNLNMTTNDEASPMDIANEGLDSDVEMEPFKPVQGRISTPYFLRGAEWKSYCGEIDRIDINPYKGDWLDRAMNP